MRVIDFHRNADVKKLRSRSVDVELPVKVVAWTLLPSAEEYDFCPSGQLAEQLYSTRIGRDAY